jgi:hypothetical protein
MINHSTHCAFSCGDAVMTCYDNSHITEQLFPVSPKNNPDVNKEEGQSPSAHHTIGGRVVRVCQPVAHSQEMIPLFNSHFSVIYWPGDYTNHFIITTNSTNI